MLASDASYARQVRRAGRIRKLLWAASFSLLGASSIALLCSRQQPRVVVQRSLSPAHIGATSARDPSRCPYRTLEDHGVCVPVPRTHSGHDESDDFVPKLPERPQSTESYRLPGTGRGAFVPLREALAVIASAPHLTPSSQPVLLLDGSPGTPVHHRPSQPGPDAQPLEVLARSTGEGWVLLGQASPREVGGHIHLWLYAGLDLAEFADASPPLSTEEPLVGHLRGERGLVAVRRLRPGHDGSYPKRSRALWSPVHSVGIDIRNLLPVK